MARARTGSVARAVGVTDDASGNGPRLPRVYIPRHRLWEQLDRATEGALTLLVAPGGAGKTLGVGGWVTVSSMPHARSATWIQGDDPAATDLLERLVAADGAGGPAAESSPPLVIVDDAHALPAATVRMLDELLTRAPETMRVLLLSRWDLALTRLVPELLGHFTILRGEILRLTDSESAELITEHARTDHPEVIRIVSERAQGWCAVLVLAARTVGAARDPVAAAEDLAVGGTPTGSPARCSRRSANDSVISCSPSPPRAWSACPQPPTSPTTPAPAACSPSSRPPASWSPASRCRPPRRRRRTATSATASIRSWPR
jgi:hypothetical protein